MRLVLTGGGTGGHIYPGLSLWRCIERELPGAEVLYIGSERGLERELVTHAGLPFAAIPAAGLKRQLSLSALKTGLITYRGFRQAKKLLREFAPDVVVGTGGYVTLPVVYAASARKVPAVIWEANARPGLTNQLCAKKAYGVAVSFADSEKWFSSATRVVHTGNPRGSEVTQITEQMRTDASKKFGIIPGNKVIVCFFGSRGSQSVNDVFLKLFPRFAEKPGWQLIYVTGEAHHQAVIDAARDVPANVRIEPFIHDMPSLLPLSDVMVTRAGGSTLAEICSLGLASVLIPSPYVTANHQEENARRLADHDAAKMIREQDVSPDGLWDALTAIIESSEGASIREAAASMATPDAVQKLYQLVVDAAGTART